MIEKELKLAYLAGLIDGEGYIGIIHNSHLDCYQLRVVVEMTDNRALFLLDELFKGKWYFKPAKEPRKARHIWMSFNSNAEKILQELLPYLRIKIDQAELALIGDWSSFKGKLLSEQQKILRKELFRRMTILNQRGYIESKIKQS